jgi:hypothetical protein
MRISVALFAIICALAPVSPLIASAKADALDETQSSEPCEYLNIYVDPESYLMRGKQTERVEQLRMKFLDLCATAASDLGYQIVSDPSKAYFRLRTGASTVSDRNMLMGVMVDPYLKLQHHIFVVMLDDPGFPYRGALGTELDWEFHGSYNRKHFKSWADKSMKVIWDLDTEQIDALCKAKARLLAEGWQAIEELRNELVVEMKRSRAERAKETQRKSLELEPVQEDSR